MARITELMAFQDSQKGYGAPSGTSGLFEVFASQMKEKRDEQRRQENVKKQMENAQQMMQQMAGMEDNSSTSRANVAIDDEQQKRNRGVIKVSTMLPQKEMSVDENGVMNIKIGTRQATPQEQKAQFEMQKDQMDLEREAGKRSLLAGYIKGELQEGAVIQSMKDFNITVDEFDQAAAARDRMRQLNVPMQQAQTDATQPQMGVQQPPMTMAQPQEQSFRFKPQPASEVKAIRDMAKEDKTDTIKSQSAIDSANSSLDAINHLIKNKNYFGAIEGRMPAGLNTGKREWSKNYDFLEANKILSVINEMKNQSRTGATGFGNMNEGELKVLTNASMKLDKQLDEATAEKYLVEMRDAFKKIIDREQNGYPNEAESGTNQGGWNQTSTGVKYKVIQ